MKKKKIKAKRKYVRKDVVPVTSITLTLPAQIKMLDTNGRVAGTLLLTEKNMQYKRANKKKNSVNPLSWGILERMGELGIG